MSNYKILQVIFLLVLTSCGRGNFGTDESLFMDTSAPNIADSWSLKGFIEATDANIEFLNKHPKKTLNFNDQKITYSQYAEALSDLSRVAKMSSTWEPVSKYIEESFDWKAVYGRKKWAEVLVTGYFEPIISGSLKKTTQYSAPLLPKPKEMKKIDLSQFIPLLPAGIATAVKNSSKTKIKAIVDKDGNIRPFPNRGQIDRSPAKDWKQKPLAWVDPVDSFFLQIQGSGTISLNNGTELRVGYAEQNGHPYSPLGRYLTDVIPLKEMSLQKIETHLRGLDKNKRQELMDKNASYVFFRKLDGNAITATGLPAKAGRTIATDSKLFPKGALAFLSFKQDSGKWLKQFVYDHDTGGAIKGPGRVDLFVGRGKWAKEMAGPMKQQGELYYLVPKTFNN